MLIAGGLIIVAPAASATGGDWDPRIADLAEQVEELRGLDFKHAVPVQVLSNKVFDKRYASDSKLSPKERKEWERSEASLHAVGLLESGLDPDALGDAFGENVLGFYDPRTERIVVRGNNLSNPATRAVLAHELTHVLQDQYFDLRKIDRQADKQESSVVEALVEGDATANRRGVRSNDVGCGPVRGRREERRGNWERHAAPPDLRGHHRGLV